MPPTHPPNPRGHAARQLRRVRGTDDAGDEDRIAEEVPVALAYNGIPYAVMMATPCDLEEFALGFSLSEGLVDDARQLLSIDVHSRLEGIELALQVADDAAGAGVRQERARSMPGRSGCGLCGSRTLEDAVRQPPPVAGQARVDHRALARGLRELAAHQPINAATGAVHAAAWTDTDGRILLAREDVGRHNALDKLIGAMSRNGHAPAAGMLLLTSRASYEMVAKAAQVGIGCIVAISAPTTLAIELARSAGVCLVGFARDDGYNVYTHSERLLDAGRD